MFGPIPAPTANPPDVGWDEVTYGYVPKSKSNKVPCAPSNKTFLPAFIAS